ncbi:MAG: ABC transporter substrate-binding protein [Streptosporangiales bacterium]|nr:ABC transporter substrate-binding protein [Streptosporangiales bacterium]
MTRRFRSTVTAVLVVLLLPLAQACADQRDDAPGSTTSGPFPVTVPHAYGEAVVKERPTRVVSIGYSEHDALLALGVRPVALQQWMEDYDLGVGPWAESLLGDAKPHVFPISEAELNMGEIAKLKPDLIVGISRGVTKTDYEVLSKMAPTLVRPKGHADYTVPYDVETTMIGRAVGKEAEAKALVAKAEQTFTDAREAHPELEGKTAVIGYPLQKGGLGIYASSEGRGEFMRKLGFTIPKAVDEAAGGKSAFELSSERLELVDDVDLLVILDFGFSPDLYAKNRLYQRLSVVRQGHAVYPLPHSNAMSFNSVLSIPYCVDKLAVHFVETMER